MIHVRYRYMNNQCNKEKQYELEENIFDFFLPTATLVMKCYNQ